MDNKLLSPAVVNRMESGHVTEAADCAIIALACYLNIPYTDVIRAATYADKAGGRGGLSVRSIKKIAAMFNAPLRHLKVFDPDEDYGIVMTRNHAAVLRSGLVLDSVFVYEWADWLQLQKCKLSTCSLLLL